ncbi:Aorsin [Fulvia fulva]|uniref:Aorsin n=1 Tax=Passalora fulva TaxID=5499 RepID=A0A9Q8LCA5_PASFU|nr:Aorsin [Fulvia fulva]KAK4629397.1 Aorsin [Fulvia fulva]KAK4630053.1 Aorsin [Fulvia fulva]UJO14812.1 Aorsin [Fulvia fulva]WPV12058.1 Aorsin [Fulvia fulva]WPV27944.1 Aorsin [Fulvia fulva]
MSTIKSYFRKHNPKLPSYIANDNASNIGENDGVYNKAGRGMPDVSANGLTLASFINGTQDCSDGPQIGTSIWAAVVTLINQQRTKAGKGPVGFINPALYANPWMMNETVGGSNANCGSAWFEAVPVEDPVSGLGTPKYPKLVKYFLSCK